MCGISLVLPALMYRFYETKLFWIKKESNLNPWDLDGSRNFVVWIY